MAREEVSWATIWAVIEAQPPWSGAQATWEAIGARLHVSRVLFSKARQDAGYRLDAVGFLPAVLVVPLAWRPVLPPVPEAWSIPASQEDGAMTTTTGWEVVFHCPACDRLAHIWLAVPQYVLLSGPSLTCAHCGAIVAVTLRVAYQPREVLEAPPPQTGA